MRGLRRLRDRARAVSPEVHRQLLNASPPLPLVEPLNTTARTTSFAAAEGDVDQPKMDIHNLVTS